MPSSELKLSFIGCLLGLALGDALGAPFEGGLVERALWQLIGKTRDGRSRWTDDTQMSLDIAESLIARRTIDQDDIAHRFAQSYNWSRGYGPGAVRTLKRIRRGEDWRIANTRVYLGGSFGNGGAMRAPVVGLFFSTDLDMLAERARATAAITHAHPLGQEGAALIALAVALILRGEEPNKVIRLLHKKARCEPFRERLRSASSLELSDSPTPDLVRQQLGNGIAATDSCVTAIYIALRFMERPLSELLEFVVACRGDTDTIGAMAGAIWGTRNSEAGMPADKLDRLEDAERIRRIAEELHDAFVATTTA